MHQQRTTNQQLAYVCMQELASAVAGRPDHMVSNVLGGSNGRKGKGKLA